MARYTQGIVMEDQRTVRFNWIYAGMFLAAVALAAVPGGLKAADTKSDGGGVGGAPSQEALPAPEPFQEEDLSDPAAKKEADDAYSHFRTTVDVINENVGQEYGGPPFPKMKYNKPRVVTITPNPAWMKDQRNHYRNAMMLYRMWRTANQFHPVMIMITDDKGGDYITIKDTPKGLEYRARQF